MKKYKLKDNVTKNLIKKYNSNDLSSFEQEKTLKILNNINALEKSTYRRNVLLDNNQIQQANQEKETIKNLVQNLRDEDIVLKGSISNVKYVWVSEEDSCDECQSLDGTEYDNEDDIPEQPHPNCKCYIDVVYDEAQSGDEDECDCPERIDQWLKECEDACLETENAETESHIILIEIEAIKEYIESYPLDVFSEFLDEAENLVSNAVEELTDIITQIVMSIQIFADNYESLIDLKDVLLNYLDGSAEYYHTKANCEAAQLGDIGEMVAEMLGFVREYLDFIKEFIFRGYSIKDTFEHMIYDLKINEDGRQAGRENPDADPEDIIIPPDGMPPEFR